MKDTNITTSKTGKIIKPSVLIMVFTLLVAACSPSVQGPTLDIQATLAAKVSGTLTAAAPVPSIQPTTIAPIPTVTQSLQPTASFSGLQAVVGVTSIILRSGPSTLFDKITTFPEGTEVTIMGKIPNAEWVWVVTPKASSGWMSTQFLNPLDLTGVPNMDVPSSFTIKGNVLDMDAQGVDGIDVVVFQGDGSSQKRTDTYTASDGSFTVYLPDTSQGVWNVGTAGIKCTSRVMDAFCKTTGSIITPTFGITLPQTVPLLFNYDPNTP